MCTCTAKQHSITIARAITDCIHTRKSTNYCPNCTLKCVINTNNNIITHMILLNISASRTYVLHTLRTLLFAGTKINLVKLAICPLNF